MLTRRGFGRTPAGRCSTTAELRVALLVAFVLAGHSFGTDMASHFLLAHPERVAQ
jgi:pimeloyl-ACP methyl ester carboxylesterase